MLNKGGNSGHFCLLPDLREKSLQYFTIEYDVSCGLVTYDIY